MPVRGSEIAVAADIVDLAVQNEPALAVWAFTAEGTATLWRARDDREWISSRGSRGSQSKGKAIMASGS